MLILPFLAGMAGKALVGWGANKLLGGLRGGNKAGKRERKYRESFGRGIETERGRGERMGAAFEERALGYDPTESVTRSVEGAYNYQMPKLRASQVGQGRLRTGFGFADQDEMMRNIIMSRAMEGEQLKMRNLENIGGFGERAAGRALDADFGRYSTERMAREQRAASKRGMWGNIIGQGLSAAGQIIAAR